MMAKFEASALLRNRIGRRLRLRRMWKLYAGAYIAGVLVRAGSAKLLRYLL